jgi:hypothetical protein
MEDKNPAVKRNGNRIKHVDKFVCFGSIVDKKTRSRAE